MTETVSKHAQCFVWKPHKNEYFCHHIAHFPAQSVAGKRIEIEFEENVEKMAGSKERGKTEKAKQEE